MKIKLEPGLAAVKKEKQEEKKEGSEDAFKPVQITPLEITLQGRTASEEKEEEEKSLPDSLPDIPTTKESEVAEAADTDKDSQGGEEEDKEASETEKNGEGEMFSDYPTGESCDSSDTQNDENSGESEEKKKAGSVMEGREEDRNGDEDEGGEVSESGEGGDLFSDFPGEVDDDDDEDEDSWTPGAEDPDDTEELEDLEDLESSSPAVAVRDLRERADYFYNEVNIQTCIKDLFHFYLRRTASPQGRRVRLGRRGRAGRPRTTGETLGSSTLSVSGSCRRERWRTPCCRWRWRWRIPRWRWRIMMRTSRGSSLVLAMLAPPPQPLLPLMQTQRQTQPRWRPCNCQAGRGRRGVGRGQSWITRATPLPPHWSLKGTTLPPH